MQIGITVNARLHGLDVGGSETLLDLLRNRLGLTGTKRVCDEGECGQCIVLLDGRPVPACILLAGSCRERQIQTIEGLAERGRLHPLQQRLLDAGRLACGFCAPAWAIALKGLLESDPVADESVIRAAVSGIVCRCGASPLPSPASQGETRE